VEQSTHPAPPNPRPPSRWVRLRQRFIHVAAILALLGLGLTLAHRPLLIGFAHLFRVNDPAPSDALVLLHGGRSHRLARLLQLYREGLAPVILMGELGITPILEVDETERIRNYLITNGVPPGAIRILPGGVVESTADEAGRVRDYVRSSPLRRITLVTTAFHTARARWIFRKALRAQGVDVRVAAARRPEYDESNWYRTEQGQLDYFEEAIKTVRYWTIY